jgi:glutamate decarboxylase
LNTKLLRRTLELLLPLRKELDAYSEADDELEGSLLGYTGPAYVLDDRLDIDFSKSSKNADVIIQKIQEIVSTSVNTNSNGFLDKLYSAPSLPGIAAELVLAILNNNAHVWHVSPALSAIEKITARALAKQFGLIGPERGGVTMPGGAAANMTALLIARNLLLPYTKTSGVTSGHRKPAIFVSEAAHYSIRNGAQIIGLGTSAVYQIPTLKNGEMDVAALAKAMSDARDRDEIILLVAATAGTTVKGAFDSLREIGCIAHSMNAWFHVDACWGGACIFSQALQSKLDGIELADSISFNPHKLLGVPLLCSFLLARDVRTFWCANRIEAGYLFHDAERFETSPRDLGDLCVDSDWRNSPAIQEAPHASAIMDLATLTTQCGRRPDALKLYLHWLYYGTEGLASDVENAVNSAMHLTRLVSRVSMFHLLYDGEMSFTQVCFYLERAGTGEGIATDHLEVARTNSRRTRLLSSALRTRGWMIDFAPGNPRLGEFGDFLRVVCHRHTTLTVANRLFEAILVESRSILDQEGASNPSYGKP